ncbi:amino acid permease [Streptomyces sp. B1866]|uniref:amino acid permease n=1 Tax=Streptomyces sp. B1866 TaxID=3075431 RepID=UPI00288F2369|nr:amino acid permease [Streptomyces sp. B1866]MDT3396459.1 amino acid permease [Streptomyces sp. B1866]
MSPAPRAARPGRAHEAEEERLRELGYQPVLARRMGPFGNFAISFSVISVLSGCMTLYGFGLRTGGPAVMLWGWAGVGLFVLCVGLALAEVTSAFPTSGALYFMADRLGGRAWGWYTGWLNMLGLLGGIAAIDYGAAQFAGALLNLQWGFRPTPGATFGLFGCVLLLHAVLNLFGVRLVSLLNSVSVGWHLLGVALIAGVLAAVPDHHQSADFVFTGFVNDTGWSNPVYVAAMGLLLSQYTLTGYDASAHLSEETTRAGVSSARGIVRAIWVSWIAGFVLLVGLTFAIQDYDGTLNGATGVPPAQIFLDAVGGTGARLLLLVVIVAQLFCGNAAVAAASRMVFAFSRDGALPGSARWLRVSSRTQTPCPAVWLSVTVAGVLALPSLYSETAYGAVTAINVIGMTPAYAIPVLLRLRAGDRFTPGPWHLGRWSRPVGCVAVAWVTVVTVLFCLPQSSPVTVESMNYASVALAVVLVLATLWWRARRRRYAVPSAYGSPSEQAEIADGIV